MNRTGLEDDQTAALIIANWLRDRLVGEANSEGRLRRAANILDMALWWVSGPGWGSPDPVADEKPRADGCDRVVRLSSYRDLTILAMPYLAGITVGALAAIDLGPDGLTFGFGDLFNAYISY